MTRVALDTSVAVPLLLASHPDHRQVGRHVRGRELVLTAHSMVETYSVLTRLPDDARAAPADAAAAIDGSFGPPLVLEAEVLAALPERWAGLGIMGGAVYDALVAEAALQHEVTLLTRDARARETYLAVGVTVELVTG